MRYKVVTYHFGADQSSPQNLQRHYRELMDELLRQGPRHALTQGTVQWRPASDIHETPAAILVKMELAGVREEDIEITLYEDALVVAGKRDDDAVHDADVWYHEAQIRYGPFRAEILLPSPVQREQVEARYENGFLRVTLPKATRGKPADLRGGEMSRGERPDKISQPLQASTISAASIQTTEAPPLCLEGCTTEDTRDTEFEERTDDLHVPSVSLGELRGKLLPPRPPSAGPLALKGVRHV
jgi:HSP20 family molecular chaperone IbpA